MRNNLRIVAAILLGIVLAMSFTGCGESGGGNGTTTTTTGPSAPSAPTGVSAAAGNGQATITWNPVSGATSYNVYWSTTSGVTKTNGTKISSVTSPYTQAGLTNGKPYYYIVTAINSSGESEASAQVSATPAGGGQWSIQTIDQVNAGNDDISAAIDGHDAIHVCYFNFNRGLKYATNKTGIWVSTYIQEEDVNTIMDGFCDIAVDGNDNVHIVYSTSSLSSGGMGVLYYASNSSGSWIKTKLVEEAPGFSGSGIIASSNGKVHIAFGASDLKLKYLNNISGAWSSPIILGTYWASVTARLALDSNASDFWVYIVYEQGGEYPLLRCAIVDSSGRLLFNDILDGGAGDNSSKKSPNIAFNQVKYSWYVSYWWSDTRNNNTLLKLYSSPGGITTLDSCAWPQSGIALDPNGKVHISFTDLVTATSELRYATNKLGSWVVEKLPTLTNSSHSDIVIESTGKIDIIYAKAASANDPKTSLNLISR